MEMHNVSISADKCIGCGLCVRDCPTRHIALENGKAGIRRSRCLSCGHCLAICPEGAVSISGYEGEKIKESSGLRLDPDEVLDVIRFRRSIRRFEERRVPDEVLAHILEAGRLTHTAKNAQPVSYVVLDSRRAELEQMAIDHFNRLKRIAGLLKPALKRMRVGENFFFFKAPVVIVVLAKNKIDGILAAQNMEFVAEAHGLGALFSGFFTFAANSSPKIKKALGISRDNPAATVLVLGYPAVKYRRSVPREPLRVKYL